MACGWFHRDLSGIDAEALLKARGVHGSFLARPSKKNQGDFSLSVRVGELVTHIRIQNTGDYYDLYGGEKFATLSELVEYYTGEHGTLQDKDGTLIELKYPLNCSDPTTERWYHGHLSGSNAEKLLWEKGEPGTFLVRESLSKPGDFVLSVLTDEKKDVGGQIRGRVSHIKIMCENDRYTVGGPDMFDTLTDLVEHFKRKGIEELNGTMIYLKQPYYSTRVNAADIDSRVQVLEQTAGREDAQSSNKAGFWEEFDALQKQEAKLRKSRDEGMRPENKSKNRYKNILPFNDTRVVLESGDPNVIGSDYINANYVKGAPNKEIKLMQRSSLLVTLKGTVLPYLSGQFSFSSAARTQRRSETRRYLIGVSKLNADPRTENEGAEKSRPAMRLSFLALQNKCVPYWPEPEGTKEYGNYLVRNVSERDATDYKIRILEISPQDESEDTREIWHYQYLSWPDHGVPSEPGGVLSFLTQVNNKQLEIRGAGPMIVHCSAGIGRTGTIIVIDMLVETIDTKGLDCDIDIQKCIQMVREQRSGMVQTEAQYKFIYLAVSQYIETTKKKLEALGSAEMEYGNLSFPNKHTKASRKVSKNKEEVYENLGGKGKKDVKKQKSEEKKSGSVRKR
nr:PREDICTED: tyrosine-protein phosphatase non-receptor type 6 [Lepisosteus oculatus]